MALANGIVNKLNTALAKKTMSYVRIWVHLVFSTKDREPMLNKEFRYDLYDHIRKNCREKDIFLKEINGYTEHIHGLISLGKDQTIAKVSQLIKGESSFWINKNNFTQNKFSWQDDYFAVSVGESQLPKITGYIKNQEDHHTRKTFGEEVDEFMVKYGWKLIKDQP